MNENEELLILIHDNVKMGVNSTKKLLKLIKEKDNKIKNILEEELQRYEEFYKDVKSLMKKEGIKPMHSTILKDLTASTAMKTEVSKDNSDAKIASILIRGFDMGNINIEAKLKDYKKIANKKTVKIAEDVLEFGENQVKLLKSYL